MASKSLEWFKQDAHTRVTDDRQTDHAADKCVAIGGIACTARAIPPKMDKSVTQFFETRLLSHNQLLHTNTHKQHAFLAKLFPEDNFDLDITNNQHFC